MGLDERICTTKGCAAKTVGGGDPTGEAGEAGWGQLLKALPNLFESVFCVNQFVNFTS